MLALDLDHFKRVNDVYGHGAGDAVLAQTGERLRNSIRSSDTVARTGGEEFIVLVPASDAEMAASLAERLRATVAGQPFELPEGPLAVTVSVGLAASRHEDEELGAVLKRADAALYQAKATGRNRVWPG